LDLLKKISEITKFKTIIMKKNQIIVKMSVFLLLMAQGICAQVTIGVNSIPQKGTLLELKESDVSDDGANSKRGMIFPRVALSDPNNLIPMLSEADLAAANKLQYKGLTVYNVTVNDDFNKGLYVWDGAIWKELKQAAIIAANGLSLLNDSIILGGKIIQNTNINLNNKNLTFNNAGNVGIGTVNPTAKLDVAGIAAINSTLSVGNTLTSNGTTILKSLQYSNGEPLTQLAVDDASGMVYQVGTLTNSTPFNYITYRITLNTDIIGTSPGDWLNSFDTKIPTSDYTLIVTGSDISDTGGMITNFSVDFGAKQIYADKTTSSPQTWYLHADYDAAKPVYGNCTWTIYCIAINNSFVKYISTPVYQLGKNNTGSGYNPL
jgi:hypothetical protein